MSWNSDNSWCDDGSLYSGVHCVTGTSWATTHELTQPYPAGATSPRRWLTADIGERALVPRPTHAFLPGLSAQPWLTALTLFTFVSDSDPRPPLVPSDVGLLTPRLVLALRQGQSTRPESQGGLWGPQFVGAAVTEHHRPGGS